MVVRVKGAGIGLLDISPVTEDIQGQLNNPFLDDKGLRRLGIY